MSVMALAVRPYLPFALAVMRKSFVLSFNVIWGIWALFLELVKFLLKEYPCCLGHWAFQELMSDCVVQVAKRAFCPFWIHIGYVSDISPDC